ncbi:DUF2199 domain-containing protein [Rufibacter glacialis]|uniref:DUF2199 domain-containing protein n=1 Tax=Rufibacter glacialis TaxID=1259555 RepID=A0A5M8Q7S7_9BACT|nr:DUF2199 domain-containing protein [Rufibacter glacialis]KAA6430994.1 DUF2199 domain-containing protein [Rufibacter glacialis]GGK83149.1 hypothetical protein GCM10011405_33720 [Rufibacter glacialis]
MPYTCADCGQEHENWPALTYTSPKHYNDLSEEEKETKGWLEGDFCTITHENDIDRFIRVVMTIPVNDHCENLDYGLWVSVSEKTFHDYQEHYHDEQYETSYFGYVCNNLLGYEETLHVPSTVVTQIENRRPLVFPFEDFEHPLVKDFYHGISKEEAEKRIEEMIQLCS